jgi:hypothetical protein
MTGLVDKKMSSFGVARVRGSGWGNILRVPQPQIGAIADAVSEAQPVQVRRVPSSGAELG